MQYLQFKKLFGSFTVFSLSGIRQAEPGFHRRRLCEWQEKGYIRKVIKGYYIFSDLALEERYLFEIANRIYSPSYVSFEMALSYYGLIPESVYGITCASTLKTARFKTPIGDFSYQTIRPKLYFGFELIREGGRLCKLASPEKAILDFLYLRPGISEADDFAGLRIDRRVFRRVIDREKMNTYARAFSRKSLAKRLRLLWEYTRYA